MMMEQTKAVRAALVVTVVAVLGLSVVVGPVAAQSGADRVVEDGERVFLGENNIDENAGVFENLRPGEFTDGDGNTLSITDGFVEPENTARTHTATDPETGEEVSVLVREARVQRVRPINPDSGVRLDFPGTPRVRPGENNLQVAVDYNYYESTEIDEELRQDGTEVTSLYLEESEDRANTGSEVTAADGTRYDAVFTFSVTDSGEYEFVAGPLTGEDRPDGRDVGFDDGETTDSYTVNVAFDETRDDEENDGDDGDEVEDGEGEENGNVTDGDDGMDDGNGEMNETDGESDGMDGEGGGGGDGEEGDGDDGDVDEEDGNVTDGDGMDEDMDGEDGETEDGGTEDGDQGGGDGEGMPGFTVVVALVAVLTAAVAVRQKA
jgi:PGF-CTERM protein